MAIRVVTERRVASLQMDVAVVIDGKVVAHELVDECGFYDVDSQFRTVSRLIYLLGKRTGLSHRDLVPMLMASEGIQSLVYHRRPRPEPEPAPKVRPAEAVQAIVEAILPRAWVVKRRR